VLQAQCSKCNENARNRGRFRQRFPRRLFQIKERA